MNRVVSPLVLGLLSFVQAASAAPLAASPHTVTCLLDGNGDGVHTVDEPIYLQRGPCGAGGTQAGDFRFLPFGQHPGGSIVSGLDDDTSRSTVSITTTYVFVDRNGNGVYNGGDPSIADDVYLRVGAGGGPLAAGDIPMAGCDTYEAIRPGDPRIGLPGIAAPVAVGSEAFAERDGQTGYTTGDDLFLDMDANLQTTIGDLRMSIGGDPPASMACDAPPSSAPTASTTATTPATTSAPPTSTSEEPDGNGAPSGSAFLLVAGIAAALLLHRRRS